VTHGHLGGRPPKVDLGHEQRLGLLMASAAQRGHVSAAHDLSDGGLAQVLVESCLRRNIGARITLPEHEVANTPFVYLFSESAGRAVVAVPRGHDKAFVALAAEHGVPCTPIGVTTEEPVLQIHNQFDIPLDELRTAYTSTMRDLFGGPGELANRHGDPEHAAHPDEQANLLTPPASTSTDSAVLAGPPADVEPDAEVDLPAGEPSSQTGSPTVALQTDAPEPAASPTVPGASSTTAAESAAASPRLDAAEESSSEGRGRHSNVFVADVVSAKVNLSEDDSEVRSVTLELTETDEPTGPDSEATAAEPRLDTASSELTATESRSDASSELTATESRSDASSELTAVEPRSGAGSSEPAPSEPASSSPETASAAGPEPTAQPAPAAPARMTTTRESALDRLAASSAAAFARLSEPSTSAATDADPEPTGPRPTSTTASTGAPGSTFASANTPVSGAPDSPSASVGAPGSVTGSASAPVSGLVDVPVTGSAGMPVSGSAGVPSTGSERVSQSAGDAPAPGGPIDPLVADSAPTADVKPSTRRDDSAEPADTDEDGPTKA
jgi:hypothetical protein